MANVFIPLLSTGMLVGAKLYKFAQPNPYTVSIRYP